MQSTIMPDTGYRKAASAGRPAIADNVTPFRPKLDRSNQVSSFDQLTARMVMQRYAAGTLDPAILAALLLAVGLQP